MFLQISMRTDIVAFYTPWLLERFKKGEVLVRNPYNDNSITRYILSPKIVDGLSFCTKNPTPILPYLSSFDSYNQYWFVTITPYDWRIERGVGDKEKIIDSFITLSKIVGKDRIVWRYDPIFIDNHYTLSYHKEAFLRMARKLGPYTNKCIISFVDIYKGVKNNWPSLTPVKGEDRINLLSSFIDSGKENGIRIGICNENTVTRDLDLDREGCLGRKTWEKIVGTELNIPASSYKRNGCFCLLGSDIGSYNTCPNYCLYCYANYNKSEVDKRYKLHNIHSPLLFGEVRESDEIKTYREESWKIEEPTLF